MSIETPNTDQLNQYYDKHCKLLELRGMQPKTVDAYTRAIRRIGAHFNGRLDDLNSDELLDYFSHLLKSHSWSAVKLDLYGLKFFYTYVLKKTWEEIPLLKPPKSTRIADIFTIDQTHRIFAATEKLSYRVFFFTLYSMGLRLEEGIHTRVGDIDADRMRVHIRDSKGNKDRLVPLPENTLWVLTNFWRYHRHPKFIFPNRKLGLKKAHQADSPMDRAGIQNALNAVVEQIGIKKKLLAIPSDTAMQLIS